MENIVWGFSGKVKSEHMLIKGNSSINEFLKREFSQSPITVLGVGNILLSDEGLGVKAVHYLKKWYKFEPQINLLDGGTLGLDLINFLLGTEKLIIIDAINGKGIAGTLYVFDREEEIRKFFKRKVSPHEGGIQEVLAWFELMGKPIKEIVIIGAQPYTIETGLELSPVIQKVFHKIIEKVLFYLNKWNVKAIKREKPISDESSFSQSFFKNEL